MKVACRAYCTLRWLFCFASALGFIIQARGDQNYSQQVFFENSLSRSSYFYSGGKASFPSTVSLVDGKLPVESQSFISTPNSLRLAWRSERDGGWSVELRLYEWRNRALVFAGANLWIWMRSAEGIGGAALPRISLRDTDRGFSAPVDLATFIESLPAGKWTRVRIPLAAFQTASLQPFHSHHLNTIVLTQNAADSAPHTLLLDDIRIEDDPAAGNTISTPSGLKAKGYERHIDLTWNAVDDPLLAQYVIYRSIGGGEFRPIGVQRAGVNRFCDYIGDAHAKAAYRVTARTSTLIESAPSATAEATTHSMTDEDLLTMVQEASFRYYWEAAEPHSGMARENTPGNDDIIAVGASGFGIMATIAGAERGFINRSEALDRMLQITAFLEKADRFHGAWPHFLSGSTGHRLPVFDMYDNGADLVETSFLMEGLLTARQYFRNEGNRGEELFRRITALWEGVEWNWFSSMPKHDALFWHWSPEYSFFIANRLTGWNEVMITYLEAIASPTHGIPASAYYTGFVGEGIGNKYANGQTYYGIKLDVGGGTGGPLFFTEYSYLGLDPHGRRDRFTEYFENNRNQALINVRYCEANPNHRKGYSAEAWGLTAVDGPQGYAPYEPTQQLDDGTIAPTGAISAMPYTPEASLAALMHFYRDLGPATWDIYGFRDAFNLQHDWVSGITMGLNQAPMAVMIENYRTGLIWKNFMANPEIQTMLGRVFR